MTKYKVIVGTLRMRSEPDTSGNRNVIGTLSRGQQITATEVRIVGATMWAKFEAASGDAWAAISSSRGKYMTVVCEPIAGVPEAAYLTSPVGTEEERKNGKVWPGHWVDVNPYGTHYQLRGNRSAYHTGADLNLNEPHWDADRDAPIYAIGHGVIVAADSYRSWGNVVVIEHTLADGSFAYSRYGHMGAMHCRAGELIKEGAIIGTIGQDAYKGPFHLHFDISTTAVLKKRPWDWPGVDRGRVYRDYVDPKEFIIKHGRIT